MSWCIIIITKWKFSWFEKSHFKNGCKIKRESLSKWRGSPSCNWMTNLKLLGKSVGLCKLQRVRINCINLLVSVWRIIYENFNPNGLILAEIWWKYKQRKFLVLEKRKCSHTIIVDNFLPFQSFCNHLGVTPSDNSFTISPHNLALLHSTLLHSYPVPLTVSYM